MFLVIINVTTNICYARWLFSLRVIIDWAKDPQRKKCPGLGLFTSKRMEDVVFEDLKVKLGYPYLYCHQGNCEHLLIFTDLR